MATLQEERDMYAQMFGEEMIVQTNDEICDLSDFDEAIFLYRDMLENTLLFRPDDAEEIRTLNREIMECKRQKRELLKKIRSERRLAG